MKSIMISKIGYTAGIYGCTNEYFKVIAITGEKTDSFILYGMYGAEDRLMRYFTEAGYNREHTPSVYGQLKRNDLKYYKHHTKSETEAIEEAKRIIGN